MDISVIVPIYGVEKYIEQALTSLFSQTKTNGVEFILVNDCSKDSSINIARDVISKFNTLDIKIIEHQKNRGVAAARQTGLDVATGEYTIHFDPDDWVEPKMLEELYACAIENDTDVVICDFYNVCSGEHLYCNQYSDDTSGSMLIHGLLEGWLFGSLWNKLIKRSLFINNDISFVENINCTEDMTICCKVFLHNPKVIFLPKAYLHYFYRDTSLSRYSMNAKKNSVDVINSTYEIERYMTLHDKYEEYHVSLNRKKITIKKYLLYYSNGKEQQCFSSLFPEINNYIMKMSYCPLHWRIAIYHASNGRLWIYNMIRKSSRIFVIIFKRI